MCFQLHYDVLFKGGGPGAKAFASSDAVKNVLEQQVKTGGLIAAVCAAPIALKAHGICKGKQLTSYPAFKEELSQDYVYSEVLMSILVHLLVDSFRHTG